MSHKTGRTRVSTLSQHPFNSRQQWLQHLWPTQCVFEMFPSQVTLCLASSFWTQEASHWGEESSKLEAFTARSCWQEPTVFPSQHEMAKKKKVTMKASTYIGSSSVAMQMADRRVFMCQGGTSLRFLLPYQCDGSEWNCVWSVALLLAYVSSLHESTMLRINDSHDI